MTYKESLEYADKLEHVPEECACMVKEKRGGNILFWTIIIMSIFCAYIILTNQG